MKKQIPNLITLANLLSGVLASLFAAQGWLDRAALFICLGIFFDFFDGMAARLLDVASPLGKELDSLADVVTSGVAPGLILYNYLNYLLADFSLWCGYIAFLMPLFAAYRLAKFNLDTRQSHSFLGLPTPANALIWVGLAFYNWWPEQNTGFALILVGISLITDILMVSELPMFSLKVNFKDLSWKTNCIQYIFLIVCAAIIAATRQWYAISLIILWYILLSIITRKRHNAE